MTNIDKNDERLGYEITDEKLDHVGVEYFIMIKRLVSQ